MAMQLTTLKVVTVTLNPALDLTGHLQTLAKGSVNQVKHCALEPAGKGVNVAKVLADLGADVIATGFLGIENEAPFCQLFERTNITDKFIRVQGATRINVKLVEANSQVSDINFPGVSVTAAALVEFETMLFNLSLSHDVFIIAGSLPVGVSPEVCANWIEKLQQAGKKVFFDSSNAALSAGLAVKPWLIKPNDEELAHWAASMSQAEKSLTEIAQQLSNTGIANVVVSLGADGVMWLNKEGWLQAKPPTMDVVSTVGAGDTLVAGICWGHLNNWDKEQTLRFATALSALAVTQVGVGVKDINSVFTMSEHIAIC
ncbi:1-phosphofructokinase [Moritella viscosa]|uniref:Phosphofructokinase n=1 Tax=Moritella viscosa TaxID=80854 RepID=A0A090KAZ4_9GAMM|nr:1-phosphofructokinase [Moritella viscosa]CED61013.1 1-phosphofructokinase [Moritella viscosa]SGY95278.1 Putative 1-phosphofructokinase [Moritella viscosa]SGZ00669.1 Putative 1-phosphofructokinase [Moritella viscosa]SGZ07205.1 Putative 1-phosphofructokinase [Moritella viscosa]SGZ07330.1 Putative 1-phosphofructokinase [Moritella viscosa]